MDWEFFEQKLYCYMNFYEVNIKILLENYTYVKNQSDKKIRNGMQLSFF